MTSLFFITFPSNHQAKLFECASTYFEASRSLLYCPFCCELNNRYHQTGKTHYLAFCAPSFSRDIPGKRSLITIWKSLQKIPSPYTSQHSSKVMESRDVYRLGLAEWRSFLICSRLVQKTQNPDDAMRPSSISLRIKQQRTKKMGVE